MAAERDDPFGAELLRREHGREAYGAIADDGDRLAGPGLGGDGTEPAGTKHVGCGHERGNQLGVGLSGRGNKGAVGERNPRVFGLCAHRTHADAMDTTRLVTRGANLTRVVRGDERANDEVARLHARDLCADLGDRANVLVPHKAGAAQGIDAAVGPKV